jgi:nicotinate dehydrogenase subunit A
MTQTTIRLTVNGLTQELDVDADTALLYVLRNDLALNGPKFGCGLGECGACTVLIDGVAARACVIPVKGCTGREIVTLEGLGSRERPDPHPTEPEAREALRYNLCRCGAHVEIMRAVMRAAGQTAEVDG